MRPGPDPAADAAHGSPNRSQEPARLSTPSRSQATLGTAALLAVAAAVLFGEALRLHGYTRHDLWLDEANSVSIARHAFGEIPALLARDSSPPIYYWLLHLWIRVMGESEASVRLPSVLLGAVVIAATAALAYRLAGERAAVAAAWLIAVTPMAVQFSQQTRQYMLLPLFAVLATERLLVFLRDGTIGALVGHALALVACFYTHNWGLLLFPGFVVAVALGPRTRWRPWGAAAALALVSYVPWIPALREQMAGSSYRFIGVLGESDHLYLLPFKTLQLFASGVGNPGEKPMSLVPEFAGFLVAGVWIAIAATALVLKPALKPAAYQVLAPAFAPLLIAIAWQAIGNRPIYFLGRYEVMVLPLVTAVVASGAVLLFPWRWAAALMAGWAVVLAALSWNYTSAVRRTYPEPIMARALAPALRPGDRVVFTGLFRATTEYYLRQVHAPPFDGASFPPDVADHLGWHFDDLYDVDDPALAEAARTNCPAPGRRTWVVGSADPTTFLLLRVLGTCAIVSKPFAAKGRPASSLFLAEPPPAP